MSSIANPSRSARLTRVSAGQRSLTPAIVDALICLVLLVGPVVALLSIR